MDAAPYRVRVVVDPTFGERITGLPPYEPVWVVESPTNTPVAKRLWDERPGRNHLTGITTFRAGAQTGEDLLLDIIGTVDLHHGVHSADPPYSVVQVHGVKLSPAVEQAFRDLSFSHFQTTGDGFVATREPT
jgi:hypothetical protein